MTVHESLQPLASQLSAEPAGKIGRAASLIEYVWDYADDLIDGLGGAEPLIVEINKLYDQYVAPYDVPGIPDALEPALIDAPVKLLIASIVRRLHDRIHKD